LHQYAPLAEQKGIDLTCSIDPTLNRTYRGDAAKIRQILLNLLHNAIKFTSEGAVQLIIEPDSNGNICFVVKDTGIGITSEEAEVIFEPFVQANKNIQKEFGGSGLGLAICKQLSRAMKARLELRPMDEPGACFVLIVPLLPSA